MPNKISEIFKSKKCLITYLAAGDPSLDKTEEFIVSMADNGADLIEIGIPFSDPVAEGEVIQNAMERALSKNITPDDIFNMASNAAKKFSADKNPPLAFMTYLNPLLTYGYDKFFKKCGETGIEAVIIPDMPFEERDEIKEFTDKYGITIITLISPASLERIKKLAKNAEGFIYLISSLGVTGVRGEITTDINSITSKIKQITDVPVAVGFGISNAKQAKDIAESADGVIIGSAIVKIISEYKENAAAKIADFVSNVKKAING